MNYNVNEDLKLIREMLSLSQQDLGELVGINKKTVTRIENEETYPIADNIEKIYSFAYNQGIKINHIKEMLFIEENPGSKIIFHGSKDEIHGKISLSYSRKNNDFGQGFYCGESSEQTLSFVARFPESSMYIIKFDNSELKIVNFNVDTEWMLVIAYYRGRLEMFNDNDVIKNIINKVNNADVIYAPIADNRMFMIIDRFIDGLITDEQCKHCLAATNLGKQYVFLNEKAISKLSILEKCYISKPEREFYIEQKKNELQEADNKVRYAMIKYKNVGKYIEEILV